MVTEQSVAAAIFFVPKIMSVTVDTTRLNRIIRTCDGEMADVIATVAFAIERIYKINVPVDTGATRSSTFTKLKRGGHQPAQRDGVVYVDLPEPQSDLEAIVGPTTEYAIDIELGTNRMAARPVLTQAVEQVTNDMERHHSAMGRALSG